jgi:hypothetical protein
MSDAKVISHRTRREATEKYMAGPRQYVEILICNCRSFDLPHSLDRHKELAGDWDWRTEAERRNIEYVRH